ncbi:flagellar export chaperone FliS [Chitinibacter sp. GC72]|uniref:flagellar export chaperone FliS n=1 Tax=Chitinibacter sp. GC72 TaxID=1526917 RepID=UPI0012F9FC6E|nr:flagellar export chaperone FliS [Chitinibacter sp. GC72]
MIVNRKAINAYGSTSLECQVEAASPHQLVVMLFDGVIKSINIAKFHLQQGNVAEKGMALTKAIAIIEEGLRLSLDINSGGELAENLDALYEYSAYQLLQANLKNDESILDQVLSLMNDLRASWLSINPAIGTTNRPDEALINSANILSYGRG